MIENRIETHGHAIEIVGDTVELVKRLDEFSFRKVFLVCDTNTYTWCFPLIRSFLQSREWVVETVPAGDRSKNPSILQHLWNRLAEEGMVRSDLLVNLGGGMVCDLGGMAAATFHRGMSFINIPTSLLAMVDASAGGKTGINLADVKNVVGVFSFPNSVWVCPEFLRTLPERELRSGFVEMLKHALLSGPEAWTKLSQIRPELLSERPDLIGESLRVKAEIVKTDPFDQGKRQVLNLGHSAGHALETLSHRKGDLGLLHGEAVALGLIVELFLSVRKAGLSEAFFEESASLFRSFRGPWCPAPEDIDLLIHLCGFDKKNHHNGLRFSLLKETGHAIYGVKVTEQELREAFLYGIQFCHS